MKCTHPALARELFESASLREIAEHRHLAACPACRSEYEQLSRMHAHWDREPLSQAELLRLEIRCRPRPLTKKRRSRSVAWAAFGGVLALGTAAAAAAGYLKGGAFSFGSADRASESQVEEAAEPVGRSTGHAARTKAPSSARQMQSAEEDEQPATSVLPALDAAPTLPSTRKEPSSRKDASAPAAISRDPGWIEAADALKRDDHVAAERALKQLSKSGNAVNRDAASLTLAETYLSRGLREQAAPILRRLAAEGATATIRSRAQKLLQ